MKVHYYLGLVLLSILTINVWKSTVVEGMVGEDSVYSSPAGSVSGYASLDHFPPKPPVPIEKSKPLNYNKELVPMCEGGFVLPGFPYTMQ